MAHRGLIRRHCHLNVWVLWQGVWPRGLAHLLLMEVIETCWLLHQLFLLLGQSHDLIDGHLGDLLGARSLA